MLHAFVRLAFAHNCKRPSVRSWTHYLSCNEQQLLLYDLINGFFFLCQIIVACYSYKLLFLSSRKAEKPHVIEEVMLEQLIRHL